MARAPGPAAADEALEPPTDAPTDAPTEAATDAATDTPITVPTTVVTVSATFRTSSGFMGSCFVFELAFRVALTGADAFRAIAFFTGVRSGTGVVCNWRNALVVCGCRVTTAGRGVVGAAMQHVRNLVGS